MGKSMLTIHKELEKAEYAKSPLGRLEKEISDFHYHIRSNRDKYEGSEALEELMTKIDKIRTENEKWNLDYIERTNREHAKAVNDKLFEAMSEEVKLITSFKNTTKQI